jgi:hypothetical protein
MVFGPLIDRRQKEQRRKTPVGFASSLEAETAARFKVESEPVAIAVTSNASCDYSWVSAPSASL